MCDFAYPTLLSILLHFSDSYCIFVDFFFFEKVNIYRINIVFWSHKNLKSCTPRFNFMMITNNAIKTVLRRSQSRFWPTRKLFFFSPRASYFIFSSDTYTKTHANTQTFTYTHTHTNTHTHTHTHTHTQTHTHTYICTHIYIHTYTYIHRNIHIHTDTHTPHTYSQLRHTHIHTCIHTHTHTYTLTHT